MKISNNFILSEIAGNYIVMPCGDNNINLNYMITLNQTGVFLWQQLEKGAAGSAEQLAQALAAEYEVDLQTALKDTDSFIGKLQSAGILD